MEQTVDVNNHIVYNSNGYVNLSNMTYQDNGNINWNDSVGAVIPFFYRETNGELVYIERVSSDKIKVLYKNNYIITNRTSLSRGTIGRIIDPNKFLPKYSINDEIKGKFGIIIITGMFYKNNERYYKYTCLSCGYKGEIRESTLNRGQGCPCCAGNIIVSGINDFGTKYPELAQYLVDKCNEKLGVSSRKVVAWHCPNCEHVVKDTIKNVVRRGIVCEKCGDKLPFSESVLSNILDQLNIEFEIHKKFDWSKNLNGNYVFYDFFIPSMNCIIETHGIQHYEECNHRNFKPLKYQRENDAYKEKLAINNGILYYIVLDCRQSRINWIKKTIENNITFCSLFDIDNINWNMIMYQKSKKSEYYSKICNMWNNGYSISMISDELQIDRHFATLILKYSVENNDTNYSPTEANKRGILNCKSTKLRRPIICLDTGHVFQSISLCERISQEILNVQINRKTIVRQIKKQSSHKGFFFEYITCEEFNAIKKESPELAFGDFFMLESNDKI